MAAPTLDVKRSFWNFVNFTAYPLVNLSGFKNGACYYLLLMSCLTNKHQPSPQEPLSSFRATQKFIPWRRYTFHPQKRSYGCFCLKVPAPLKRPTSSCSGKAPEVALEVGVSELWAQITPISPHGHGSVCWNLTWEQTRTLHSPVCQTLHRTDLTREKCPSRLLSTQLLHKHTHTQKHRERERERERERDCVLYVSLKQWKRRHWLMLIELRDYNRRGGITLDNVSRSWERRQTVYSTV